METKNKNTAAYPARKRPPASKFVDAKPTPGRHAEAVKEHLKLRKGQ